MNSDRRKWHLVIADDSPEDRAEIRRLLLMGSERHYQFTDVETGAAACRAITAPQAEMPTCLILDFHLPDAEAPEVIDALLSRRGVPICPIVVITSSSHGNVGAMAIRAGAQDFVGKNWMTPESLTRAVENAVSRWRMVRNMAVHLGVVQILAASTHEEQLFADTLEILGEELNCTAGAVWVLDPTRRELRCQHVWERSTNCENIEHRSCFEAVFSPDDGLAGYVWTNQEPVWWGAWLQNQQQCCSQWLNRSGFSCAAAFPIVCVDEYLGVIELYCHTKHERDSDLTQVFEAVGNQIGLTIKRTRTERQVRENEEQLRRLVRYYDFFIGVLGHDLRNPLAGILTGAELGLRVATEDRSKNLFLRIKSSGQRMQRLIEQLLDVTRIRSGGGLALQCTLTNLEDLTRATIDELADLHGQVHIDLHVIGNPTGEWDADRLAQVLSNLIGNAVQHSLGSRKINVMLNGSSPDHVEFSVQNEGTIPLDVLPTLFDPFVKAAHGTHKTGLGLGLYISQQIILAHDGQINVRSDIPTGTTFYFLLPRQATSRPTRSNEVITPK